MYNGAASNVTTVLYGVPQSLVLEPVLFRLHVAGAIHLVKYCDFCFHA